MSFGSLRPKSGSSTNAQRIRSWTAHRDAETTMRPARSNLNACDAAMTNINNNAQANKCVTPSCWIAA